MSEEKNFFPDSAAYDRTMGRMSRIAGAGFLAWLSLPAGLRWLDVGCGTGSFTELVLDRAAPDTISAVDPSAGQIAVAKGKPGARRVDYRQGDAVALPFGDDSFDVAVMALVVQYLPDPARSMAEITRVVRPGGTVAAYVWPGPLDGHPFQPLNEAFKTIGVSRRRRPGGSIRTMEGLTDLFRAANLDGVESRSIDIEVEFSDFDDCWSSQSADTVRDMAAADIARLKAAMRQRLPAGADGRIRYGARANAARGRVRA